MTIAPEDLDRIATRLERTAELLRERGSRALDVTKQWRDSLRASSLEPAHSPGGHGDPTGGEASGRADREATETKPKDTVTKDHLAHHRVNSAIEAASHAAGVLTDLIVQVIPDAPKHATNDTGPGEGWCRSCWRDGGYLEPEATHRDGRVKHSGACTWCANFNTEYGQNPPLELLRKRHAGKRISVRDITQTLRRKTA